MNGRTAGEVLVEELVESIGEAIEVAITDNPGVAEDDVAWNVATSMLAGQPVTIEREAMRKLGFSV